MSVLKPEITGKHYEKPKKQQLIENQKNAKSWFLHLAWIGRFVTFPRSFLRHYPQHLFAKNATTKFRPNNGIRTLDA